MIQRTLEKQILKVAKGFPAIAIMGPRQSGKTTLAKKAFPHLPYISLEDLSQRSYAQKDPKGFLSALKDGAILDEVQRVPELFSYLQEILDSSPKRGWFVLTGSEHFLLHEKISQSLAGRVAYKNLLPFSLQELRGERKVPNTPEGWILKGFYPSVHVETVEPYEWLKSYINSYLEKDVRSLKNVHDLSTFQTFLQICAGRTGQLINLSSIAVELGVNHNTVKSWLSILETSFIIFFLKPHHKNFRKRLVKSQKLYFWDTGLVSALLNIRSTEQLNTHPLKGALFENLIVADLAKQAFHHGEDPALFFWRDTTGLDVYLLWDLGNDLIPIAIKAGKTIRQDCASGLSFWCQLSGISTSHSYLVHAGEDSQKRKETHFMSWRKWGDFFEKQE
jgi:predicted AAA+ superfamily ATPase